MSRQTSTESVPVRRARMVHRLTHREPQCQNALFRRVPMCDARKRRRYRAIPFLWHLSLGKIRNSCRLCQKAIAAGPGETVICRGDRIGKEELKTARDGATRVLSHGLLKSCNGRLPCLRLAERPLSTQSGCSKESYPATGTGAWSIRVRIAAATRQNLCAATLKTADELVTAQSAGTSPTRFVTAGRRCEGRPFTSLWPTASPRARAGSAPFQWCPQRA